MCQQKHYLRLFCRQSIPTRLKLTSDVSTQNRYCMFDADRVDHVFYCFPPVRNVFVVKGGNLHILNQYSFILFLLFSVF